MTRWIRRFTGPKAVQAPAARLICFPHAGAGASAYRRWDAETSAALEVLAVQPPGREDRIREPPVSTVEAMAEAVTVELEPWSDRPVALFGNSFGALVAYEVARRVERELGDALVLLTVAAASPPPVPSALTALPRLDVAQLAAALARRGWLPAEVREARGLLALLLAPIRADLEALGRYRLDRSGLLACPIITVAGAADTHATPARMQEWRGRTDGPATAITLPGGHLFVLERGGQVAREIEAAVLARVRDEPVVSRHPDV